MINYFSSFLKNNLMIVILIIIVVLLLALFSKKIRNILYTFIISTTVPFGVALMHKLGLGLNGPFTLIERLFYLTVDNIERAQEIFLDKSDILLFAVNFENEVLNISIDFISNLHINTTIVVRAISSIIENAKIEIKNRIVFINAILVKRMNISRLSLVYRL